jgi:hypothetical protein
MAGLGKMTVHSFQVLLGPKALNESSFYITPVSKYEGRSNSLFIFFSLPIYFVRRAFLRGNILTGQLFPSQFRGSLGSSGIKLTEIVPAGTPGGPVTRIDWMVNSEDHQPSFIPKAVLRRLSGRLFISAVKEMRKFLRGSGD